MARPTLAALAAVALGLASPLDTHGQPGVPYVLTSSAIAGGGGMSIGALGTGYQLGGTIGQPSTGPISGGGYTMHGGLWSGGILATVGVEGDGLALPVAFRVHRSVPNPFSTSTTIAFELPAEQRVQMAVYSLKGERVRELLDQVMPAGRHSMTWAGIGDDGRQLPPGVYWIMTQGRDRKDVHRTVLVK